MYLLFEQNGMHFTVKQPIVIGLRGELLMEISETQARVKKSIVTTK